MMFLDGYYQGDCLEVMADIPDRSIDMVLCDLPYGTTACKWDVVIPFDALWAQYARIVKPDGAILLFGTEPFSSHLRLSNLKHYRYDWVWDKRLAANFLFMNKQPGKITESISVFYKRQPAYNPQKRDNPNGPHKGSLYKNPAKVTQHVKDLMGETWRPTEMGDRQNVSGKTYEADKLLPTNILSFPKDRERLHPTQKPVALLEYLIRTYTHAGDVVLDNCAGSASTGVACVNTGRRFMLIEQDSEYFRIGQERVLRAKECRRVDATTEAR